MRIIFLISITLIGLFFYTFRLGETQLFRNDPARDTLKVLRIWQNKEITLIGPPVSFTERTTREAYLGSLYLYIGLIGLKLANWDPVGAVLPNVFFFTLSIPFFFLLMSRFTNSFQRQVVTTIFYTLSPITVTHARFFWNPNLIIPASVFFWYLALKQDKNKKINIFCFFSGLLAGLIFNFHYLAALPLIAYILMLFFSKQTFKGLTILAGLVISSLPIIIFEIKHHFYLTQALFQNLIQGHAPTGLNILGIIYYFFNIFWSMLGLRQSEIDFPTPFMSGLLPDSLLYIVTTIILIIIVIKRSKNKKDNFFWPVLGTAILLTIYFSSGNPVRLRYLFSVYPILIGVLVNGLFRIGPVLASVILIVPSIATSITIISHQPTLAKDFIKLSLIEDICQEIVKDSPSGNYNITENLKGDARAMSFRYCVTKDAKVKPNDELSYNNLTSLYVISPSLEKIYKENRWEFYASAPWKLAETNNLGEVKLFKFIKDK